MLGKNTFQIQKYPAMQMGNLSNKIRNRKDISIEEYSRLKKLLDDAKSIGAEQWRSNRIIKSKWESTNPNISLCGLTPEAITNNQWIISVRFIEGTSGTGTISSINFLMK